mgnify:CR=1 FL=1
MLAEIEGRVEFADVSFSYDDTMESGLESVRRFVAEQLLAAPHFAYIREYFPEVTVENWSEHPDFVAKIREFVPVYLDGDTERAQILCNIADRPEVCNFILPAIVRRGDLVITISTSGNSPALAKRLRLDLEKQFGDEYADFLRLMGAIREKLLSQAHEPEAHKDLFNQLIDRDLIGLIKANNIKEINALLLDVLGEGFKIENLL